MVGGEEESLSPISLGVKRIYLEEERKKSRKLPNRTEESLFRGGRGEDTIGWTRGRQV